jgi:hypothetical protein
MEGQSGVVTWRKSSFSGNNGGQCVEVGQWRRSTHSAANGGQCVEAGTAPGTVYVRDTKQAHLSDARRTMVPFPVKAWAEFTAALKK